MNEALIEVKKNILGNLSIGYYISAFFFSCLAIILVLYVKSIGRDRDSKNTPVHYSWKFLLWDNFKKITCGLIVMYLFYRFTSEALNRALSMWVAVGIGFFVSMGVAAAIEWLQERFDFLCMPREKYMQKLEEKAKEEVYNRQQ
jgi:type IV secretory pathway TraG/TraD family ATPase VirD4